MIELKGKYTTAKIMCDSPESSVQQQLFNVLNHPIFKDKHIAIMPDTHVGNGCVIGLTVPMGNAVIPNVVGVDIGCGVSAIEFGYHEKLDRRDCQDLDKKIRNVIPTGQKRHKRSIEPPDNLFLDIQTNMEQLTGLKSRFDEKDFMELANKVGSDYISVMESLGTLGGGNHFIELSFNAQNSLWGVVHSGSRNFGLRICQHHQKKAKQYISHYRSRMKDEIEEIKQNYSGEDIAKHIEELSLKYEERYKVPPEVVYIEDSDSEEYKHDMTVAQVFAHHNRKLMLKKISEVLNYSDNPIDSIESVHNYIDPQDHIIRKGAIRSYKGEKLIIPLNSRDGFIIGEGKSNPDWNFSAPHGAGRLMSRSRAKERLTKQQVKDVMRGIFSSVTPKDESPLAYKDAGFIIEHIKDTVVIHSQITPHISIKSKG